MMTKPTKKVTSFIVEKEKNHAVEKRRQRKEVTENEER